MTRKFLKNSEKIHEISKKSRTSERNRLRVLKDLWEMENGEKLNGKTTEKWGDLLKSDQEESDKLIAPMKPGYDNEGGERRKKSKKAAKKKRSKSRVHSRERSENKNLTESMSKKEVKKESVEAQIHRNKEETSGEKNDKDSTDVSLTLASKDSSKSSKTSKSKSKSKSSKEDGGKRPMSQSDYFVEVIINELKTENRELKWALSSRDAQLTKAAEKVREMVAENGKLARKLERALSRASAHAQNYDDEIAQKEGAYEKRIAELSAQVDELERNAHARGGAENEMGVVVSELRRQLAEKERDNENLLAYIESLKQSYQSVYGGEPGEE